MELGRGWKERKGGGEHGEREREECRVEKENKEEREKGTKEIRDR